MSGDARPRGARLRRLLAVVGVTAASVVGLAVPAAAADEPPGWTAPVLPNGEWIAFTVAPQIPVATGRSTFAPVTLSRLGNVSDLLNAFSNWDTRPNQSPPGPDETGWPSTFDVGSVQLQRADPWCDYTATDCRYTVVHGGTFLVQAGTPLDANGVPEPSQFPASQVIDLPAAKVLHVGFSPELHPTPGAVGQAGHVTLDATTFTLDDCTTCGPLTYHWVVQNVNDTTKTFTSDIGPQVQLDINENGTYCVQLTVTAGDGASESTPTCDQTSAVHAPTFIATDFVPKTKQHEPTPNPTPPAGGGGTSGGGGFGGITFSNPPRHAPAVLSSAGLSSPAVVWLWRPDFFQPTPQATSGAPITTNTPNLKGRHEIVVTAPGPDGASAGPWLAGMGAFGIAGGGWVLSRRRRLRLLDLEP